MADIKDAMVGSVVDVNPITIALTGDAEKLIEGHNHAQATLTVDEESGIVFDENLFIIRNGDNTGYGQTHIFENTEDSTFRFQAEDDKGNVGVLDIIVDMINYIDPTCLLTCENPDGNGNVSVVIRGSCYNGSFGAVNNTFTFQYRYKVYGGSYGEWIDASPKALYDGITYYIAVATEVVPDYRLAYTFQARTIDKLNTVYSKEVTVKSIPTFHWSEDDFVFEVPVTFNAGMGGDINMKSLYINGKTYDGSNNVNAEISGGTWLPGVLIPDADARYSVRQGWYQKIGRVVTVGWLLKFHPDIGYETTTVKIANLPYLPMYSAFGGGIAHNIYTTIDLIFEGWALDTSGNITARLQHGNKLETGELEIASSACYGRDAEMTLAGTICYITKRKGGQNE